MKKLGILLLFAVFIFGATILRMLDVKASDSTAPEPGAAFRDCSDCPEMVVIPAGNFTMGSSAAEKSWAASQVGSEVLRVIKRQPDGSWKFARVIVFDEKNESVAPMSNPCT